MDAQVPAVHLNCNCASSQVAHTPSTFEASAQSLMPSASVRCLTSRAVCNMLRRTCDHTYQLCSVYCCTVLLLLRCFTLLDFLECSASRQLKNTVTAQQLQSTGPVADDDAGAALQTPLQPKNKRVRGDWPDKWATSAAHGRRWMCLACQQTT